MLVAMSLMSTETLRSKLSCWLCRSTPLVAVSVAYKATFSNTNPDPLAVASAGSKMLVPEKSEFVFNSVRCVGGSITSYPEPVMWRLLTYWMGLEKLNSPSAK